MSIVTCPNLGTKEQVGFNIRHPTAGVTAVGCRMPLVAFNINLSTSDPRGDVFGTLAHQIPFVNKVF